MATKIIIYHNFMKQVLKKYFLLIFVFCFLFFNFNFVKADDILPIVPDVTSPIITLLGDSSININVGDTYADVGATASDDVDGDITSKIIIDNLVNTAVVGNYTVTYNVSDAAGNSAVPVVRNVIVNALPIINHENFIIRNGDKLIWQGDIVLPTAGTVSINDNKGIAHNINSQSVLALLSQASQSSGAFSISNLQYYDSFGSFYLKCLTPSGGAQLCDNWQYAVGGSTPWQSIDAITLSGNNTVGIFFGSQHRLTFNSNNLNISTPLSVKAENYNYVDDTWGPLPNISLGVTLPNSNDPWNPIIVFTKTVDANGDATFVIGEPNTYNIGIVEDYYYPTYQVIVSPGNAGRVVDDKINNIKKIFNVDGAINFLEKNQSSDGSFAGADLYTDWTVVAYGAANVKDSSRDLLLNYLKNNSKLGQTITDDERRVMALLSLGQNPYDFNHVNYIDSIIKQFDGKQFGDSNLVNDDIFAVIPLLSSGYTKDDDIIKKDIDYILSKQNNNGSWNDSIDLTSAAIQMLNLINSNETILAVNKAQEFILSKQNDNGGFDSVYSTSWAAQAMASLNKVWLKNNNSPLDYLANQQSDDGATLVPDETLANRVWSTSYAIVAALGKSWHDIFVTVSKPVEQKMTTETTEITDATETTETTDKITTDTTDKITTETTDATDKNIKKTNKAVEKAVKNNLNIPIEPIKTQESPIKKSLPFVAGFFVIIGGIFVAKLWF